MVGPSMDALDVIFAIEVIVGGIGLLLALLAVVLIPVWGVLILTGKIDRGGVFSQRAGMVFMVALSVGLLLFGIAVGSMMLTVPVI
jgi:hypothetical protein